MDTPNLKIEIICYSDDLKGHIKRLNYEWLEKYFRVEEIDALILSDPQKYIIDPGGFIFYARLNNEIVGTVALMKMKEGVFEMGKMSVTENCRNRGIGKALLEHCLGFAEKQGIKRLLLYSNRRLKSAIHLYEKYGFTEVTFEPGHYERGNIKMEIDF